MRIYMQLSAGAERNPRFYQIVLERDLLDGWNVIKEWGQVGAAGRVIKEHYPQREQAEESVYQTRDNQAKRGYRVMFIQGDMGPAV